MLLVSLTAGRLGKVTVSVAEGAILSDSINLVFCSEDSGSKGLLYLPPNSGHVASSAHNPSSPLLGIRKQAILLQESLVGNISSVDDGPKSTRKYKVTGMTSLDVALDRPTSFRRYGYHWWREGLTMVQ